MKPLSTDSRVAEPAETPAACTPDSNRGESVPAAGNTAPCCGKPWIAHMGIIHICRNNQDLMRQNTALKAELATALDRIVELQLASKVPTLPPEQHPRLPSDEEDEN